MNSQDFNWDAFNSAPIIGIIRNLTLEQVETILPLYIEAGLTTVEVSLTTPGALEIINSSRRRFGNQLTIGAGTVCTLDELASSLQVGSQFIVSPISDITLIDACVEQGIPVFPGAFTPTEIYNAWHAGATMVKVFPCILGAQYIRDIKAPFPNIKLLPTGGVGIDNLKSFVDAGAEGFGIASQLFDKELIRRNDSQALLHHFSSYAEVFS